jgi:low affinity Fe/Cu permease
MTENEQHNEENATAEDHHGEKPSYDDINTPVVLMIGVISAVMTLLTIALVQGIYNHWYAAVVQERQYNVVDKRRAEIVDEQLSELTANNQGRISIDEAMEKTLEQYRN